MDKILAESAALSPALLMQDEELYDKTANSLVTRLSSPGLTTQKSSFDNVDAAADTIAYLFMVAAVIKEVTATGKASAGQLARTLLPEGDLWPHITNILLNFDPIQARYAGQSLNEIVQVVVQGAEQTQNYIPAIQLLASVILRLDPKSCTFTSTHHAYVRLCLLGQAYAEAFNIISKQIYYIPTSEKNAESRFGKHKCSAQQSSGAWITQSSGLTQKITTRMFLEYNAMSALCLIAVGQYKSAIRFLEVILVAPTASGAASLIAIDAFKKWVLLNLIVKGSVPDYPKPAFQATARNIRSLAKPYECIAEAFKQPDPSRLMAEMNEGQDIWHGDCVTGLMQEVLEAHRKFAVLDLGKIYTAIPVSRLDALLPADQNGTPVQVYLQSLITNGELRAALAPTADGSDTVLRFLPEAITKKSEDEVQTDLNQRAQQLHSMLEKTGELEHRMHLSKEYVDYLKKLKKNRDDDNKKNGGAGNRSQQPTNTSVDLDEDMMGDEF